MSFSDYYAPSSETTRKQVERVRNEVRRAALNRRRERHGLPPIIDHRNPPRHLQPAHRDRIRLQTRS